MRHPDTADVIEAAIRPRRDGGDPALAAVADGKCRAKYLTSHLMTRMLLNRHKRMGRGIVDELIATVIAANGGGRYSVDRLIAQRLR